MHSYVTSGKISHSGVESQRFSWPIFASDSSKFEPIGGLIFIPFALVLVGSREFMLFLGW